MFLAEKRVCLKSLARAFSINQNPLIFPPYCILLCFMKVASESNAASMKCPDFIWLVNEEDQRSTSDLSYFTLMQVQPYSLFQTKTKEHTKEVAFPGLVCRHCMVNSNGRKFFTTSSDHLEDLLLTIANHLIVCKDCPHDIKVQIHKFSNTHDAQLQYHLISGSHKRLMCRVWNQLSTTKSSKAPPNDHRKTNKYAKVDQSKALVTKKDEKLVTPFTFYTMQQVRPCNLEKSGNGSRSSFEYGFPGLECIHCKGRNSRKFFYRTPEILAGKYTTFVGLYFFYIFKLSASADFRSPGNYAHVPNHLMSCIGCPPEVKKALSEKKENHVSQKLSLDKGSQRIFFNLIWKRLHGQR